MFTSFADYQHYLETNKDKLPPHAYEFAIDMNRHRLDSPHSLHDAWMTSITIKENRNPVFPFQPQPSIEIALLGQMRDRTILLCYSGIAHYQIEGYENPYNSDDTFQGDISWHEVRLNEEGLLIHEIHFVSESKIMIVCEDFRCTETLQR